MSTYPRRCLTAAAILVLFASNGFAQSEAGGGTIGGAVTDPTGAAVPGAQVSVESTDTGLVRRAETGTAGLFTFPRLPAGAYRVSVQKEGFRAVLRERLALSVGGLLVVDVHLETGSVTDSIQVTAETPVIESTRSQTSTVVTEKLVRDLPINGRNFLDFALLTPGVVSDRRVGDLSFSGQRGPANSLLVDGMDSNSTFWGQSAGRAGFRNPYSFSQDAVQEFQVNANGYAAELGRATGGVVNVVTKSGTNELHGAGFWFFRDRAMNANAFFNNAASIPRQPYHFNQFGGNLGGPVLKNRLFFFYNYDGQRNTSPNPVYFPIPAPTDAASQAAVRELSRLMTPYTTSLRNDIHTGKVDWSLNANHVISVRYNAHRFLGRNFESPGAQSTLDHTGDTILNTDSVTVSHTWILGPDKVLDQRLLYYGEDNPSADNGPGPEVVVRQSGVTMLNFGRANFLPRFVRQKKGSVVHTLTWNRGRHSFKFGHDFRFERTHQYNTTLFFGQYTFDTLADYANRRPSAFAQTLTSPGTPGGNVFPNGDDYAFFAQDAWRATTKLTLNYGLRYDFFDYASGSLVNPDRQLLAQDLRTGRIPLDRSNLAPRLGFAYRLDPDSRNVIRGGAGAFYGRLPGLTLRFTQLQNGIQTQALTLTGGAMPRYPEVLASAPPGGPVPDIYVMQPHFGSPFSYQWSFNLETRLAKDYALTLGYSGLRGVHLTRVRDINHYPYETLAARFADGTPVTVFRRPGVTGPVRPNPNFGRIVMVESGADSIYHGGFVQLTKRYGRSLQLQASYTFSKVIDTVPDATPSIPNSSGEDVKLALDSLYPNTDRGLGDNHIAHRFIGSGVWDIGFGRRVTNPVARLVVEGWQLSAVITGQSGRYFSARSNVDLNNDGNRFSDRSPGFGRNTIEGPGLAAVDLRLSKQIRLPIERLRLQLIGEAFNAFNRANFNAIQQTPFNYAAATRVFTPNATYLRPTSTIDPRIMQIAVRITF
ncbi:MAG: TonB-dependent receptor [Bryobacteraceae bacterium]